MYHQSIFLICFVWLIQSQKKKYKQNESRNILTNIGNQLITFLCSPKKSGKILGQTLPKPTAQETQDFYEYTGRIRHQTDYYLNIHKIKNFWRGSEHSDPKFDRWIRILSAYFLRWVVPLSILTSKKMSTNSRILHSRARKYLLSEIRSLDWSCFYSEFIVRILSNLSSSPRPPKLLSSWSTPQKLFSSSMVGKVEAPFLSSPIQHAN